MSKSKIVSGIIIVIVVVIIGHSIYRNSSELAETGPIVIGYVGPLTGPSAVLGMDVVPALQIAVDEANQNGGINGRQIKLIAEDDQYLTKSTVSAYNKLVNNDGAKIILISTYGGVFAVADRAKVDGVVVIDPLDCNSNVANVRANIFCLATETESIGYSLADYLLANDQLKAGVMYSTKDSFMSLVKDAFEKRYSGRGGTTFVESFNYDDADFRTQLIKLKQSAPGNLVLLGHDETGLIMKQARDLGISAKFLTTGTITSPNAQKASSGASEGTVFAYWEANPNNQLAKKFEDEFVAKVGRKPILPLTTHPAYDTMKVLLSKVLPGISGNLTDVKIKDALLKVKGYQGVTGEINMDSDGGVRIKEAVFKLVNGLPVKL